LTVESRNQNAGGNHHQAADHVEPEAVLARKMWSVSTSPLAPPGFLTRFTLWRGEQTKTAFKSNIMRYKGVLLFILTLIASVQVQAGIHFTPTPKAPAQENLDTADLPDQVAYEFFFLRAAALNARAEKKERDGKPGNDLRGKVIGTMELDASQRRVLDTTAIECLQKARELDLKARQIINNVRAHYREGRIGTGQAAPELPAELTVLQAARDSVFLQGRDSLRRQFGDEKFAEFDRFVRSAIGP
jgi:hypothetical protein